MTKVLTDKGFILAVRPWPEDLSPAERALAIPEICSGLFEGEMIDREQLQHAFAIAEDASEENGAPSDVTRLLYGIWDRIVEEMPAPDPEAYIGSAAEVSGDYGRLYYSRRVERD